MRRIVIDELVKEGMVAYRMRIEGGMGAVEAVGVLEFAKRDLMASFTIGTGPREQMEKQFEPDPSRRTCRQRRRPRNE